MRLGSYVALAWISFAVTSFGFSAPEQRQLPVYFEENRADHTAECRFVVHSAGMSVEFCDREARYRFPGAPNRAVRVHYAGYRPVHPQGGNRLAGQVNYLFGSFPLEKQTEVPIFSRLDYREMWPGIDVVYSAQDGHLKTEFQIAAGANPNVVRWTVEQADSVSIGRDGALVIRARDTEIRESAPQVWEIDRFTHQSRAVHGAFRILRDRSIGIEVGSYDRANRLIFDPVIGYSTYFGGSGLSAVTAIAVDNSGNEIIAGYTNTFDIAPGAHAFGSPQRTSAFVAKLNAAGNQILFCTYLGGDLDTRAFALALDRFGNIYLAGSTSAHNFPVRNGVQPRLRGAQDAFVTELNASGSAIVFSTYLGGSGAEQAYGIAVSRTGFIYVAGDTGSTDFPVVRPFQRTLAGGQDGWLAQLGVSGSTIIASTYLGGTADEHVAALALDASGNAVLTGSTYSYNYPVVNAFQPNSGGNQDAFVTKVNSSGTQLVFSTYLGGSGGTVGLPEMGSGVAVDSSGNVYVAGTTSSPDFPVSVGAFQTTPQGGIVDAFVSKLTALGTPVYNTYLGGSSVDYASAIAVDPAGNAHVAGYTASTDFPNLRGLQNTFAGAYDTWVTKLNSTGSGLIYSAILGGSLQDSAAALAVDRFGTVLLAGQTLSTDFPAVSGFQNAARGAESGFVTRLPIGWEPAVVSPASFWSIDNLRNAGSNGVIPSYQYLPFGAQGDVPMAGDWSNTGTAKIGIFLKGIWYLDVNGDGLFGAGDRSFAFGQAGDIPILGDWNGSGTLKAGLFRAGTFILDLSGHMSGVPTGIPDVTFSFGQPGDIPVAADWNGSGTTKVGVFRNGTWLLDWSGRHQTEGHTPSYGRAGDIPLIGDWDGSGTPKPGLYRQGTFLLDYNGNWTVDIPGDLAVSFGSTGATPVMLH